MANRTSQAVAEVTIYDVAAALLVLLSPTIQVDSLLLTYPSLPMSPIPISCGFLFFPIVPLVGICGYVTSGPWLADLLKKAGKRPVSDDDCWGSVARR